MKVKSPVAIIRDDLKRLCDSIYTVRSLFEVNFFEHSFLPLFNNDHLGDYFMPKLLYRGFDTLELDMSEVCIGK